MIGEARESVYVSARERERESERERETVRERERERGATSFSITGVFVALHKRQSA